MTTTELCGPSSPACLHRGESGLANKRTPGVSLVRANWGGSEVLLTNSGSFSHMFSSQLQSSAGWSGIVFLEGAVPVFVRLVRDLWLGSQSLRDDVTTCSALTVLFAFPTSGL